MTIFFNLSPTSNHLHPLQVENCDSNSRLVVDEDDNGKFRPKGLSRPTCIQADACRTVNKHAIYVHTMLIQCWASVADGGSILNQHWANV